MPHSLSSLHSVTGIAGEGGDGVTAGFPGDGGVPSGTSGGLGGVLSPGGGGEGGNVRDSRMQHWHEFSSHPMLPVTGSPPNALQMPAPSPTTQRPIPTPRSGTYFPHCRISHCPGGCGGIPNGGGGGDIAGGGEMDGFSGGRDGITMSRLGTMQQEHDLPHPEVNFLIGSPPSSLQREGPATHDAFSTPSSAMPVSISHVLGQNPGGKVGDGDHHCLHHCLHHWPHRSRCHRRATHASSVQDALHRSQPQPPSHSSPGKSHTRGKEGKTATPRT